MARAAKPPVRESWANAASGSPDIVEAVYVTTGFPAPGGTPVKPPRGNVNFEFHRYDEGLNYLFQRGITDWDTDETDYGAGDIVRDAGAFWRLTGTATPGTAPSADSANWFPFAFAPTPDFGDGSLGDVTISTSVPAGGNLSYRNLTLTSSGLLRFETPHILRVQGTLTIASGGIIRWGHASRNGANGGAGTSGHGAGGTGLNSLSTGYLGGGGNGGAGGDEDSTPNGVAGQVLGTARMGGAGGLGGDSNFTSTGGAAGSSTAFLTTVGSVNNVELLRAIVNGGRHAVRAAGTPPALIEFLLMGGSPGGGGAGGGGNGGGGAGAGGAVGIVVARRIVIAVNGALHAPGGNGGNSGSGGTGGGGGGGGGWLGVACGSYSGPTLTAAACCPGGTGGTGFAAGTAGSVGSVNALTIDG